MDDDIRAERDDPAGHQINGDEEVALSQEGLRNILATIRRNMVKEALGVTVMSAAAFAMGVGATFEDPEKVAAVRDAIDILAAAVGLSVDWPTDAEGNAAPIIEGPQ